MLIHSFITKSFFIISIFSKKILQYCTQFNMCTCHAGVIFSKKTNRQYRSNQKNMSLCILLLFFLASLIFSTIYPLKPVYADDFFESRARILSTAPQNTLSTIPKEREEHPSPHTTQQNTNQNQQQPPHSQTQQNQQPYSQYTQNQNLLQNQQSANTGFYFNMTTPNGPSISIGGFTNATSSQNEPVRRSQTQILTIDKNPDPKPEELQSNSAQAPTTRPTQIPLTTPATPTTLNTKVHAEELDTKHRMNTNQEIYATKQEYKEKSDQENTSSKKSSNEQKDAQEQTTITSNQTYPIENKTEVFLPFTQ